jgi:hypothetical protein
MSSDSRKTDRYLHNSKVILKDSELGSSFRGELFNFSDEGFYFETDEFMSPGADIYIGLLNSPYSQNANTYDCRRISVKWSKRLIDSGYKYGYGAEQVEFNRHTSEKVSMVKGGRQDKVTLVDDNGRRRRKHNRKSFIASVYFVSENQYCRGIIENMSRGGFFIRTREVLRNGQLLSITIPGTRFNDGTMIKAEVVRVQRDGIGVKVTGFLKHRKYRSQPISHTHYI